MKQCLQIFPQIVKKGVNFSLVGKINLGFNFTCGRARTRAKFLYVITAINSGVSSRSSSSSVFNSLRWLAKINHQLKKLLIVKRILLVSTKGNV